MKISELIAELQATHAAIGDAEVRLQCDHGQTMMSATWCGIGLIDAAEEHDYMAEPVSEEDADEDTIKVCEIQAF